jgi:hypothetical protein
MFKLISCNVFQRGVCWCLARSTQVIDVEFLDLGEHVRPACLRALIQSKIDSADATGRYDAILILFGLCGNAGVGLHTGLTRLVMPRAHDCATVLLGSKRKFQEHFESNPSCPYSSAGYFERGNYFLRTVEGQCSIQYGDEYAAYVRQYGEDDARYIWEQLHPPSSADSADNQVFFIDLPQTAHLACAEEFRKKAEAAGKRCVRLEGSIRLIRNLLNGQWDEADFLVVPPGCRTAGVYDWEEIVRSVPLP